MAGTDKGEIIETDVLVIGAGCAGCWAAIRASELSPRVTLVEKGVVSRSGTTLYCHDMLAPMPEGELQTWLREIVEHTEFMSDQAFAQVLLEEEGDRVRDMVSFGVHFERDDRGELHRSLGRGHTVSKVCTYDGRKLMEVMKRQAASKGVKLMERVMITDLLTRDGKIPTLDRVVGAVGLHTQTGKFLIFKAKAVIIATGLITAKLHFSYGDNLTGDGQAMAYRAGAELAGLEFNFGPTFASLRQGGATIGTLIQFQTQGAHIVNARGERFMERYLPERKERRATMGLLGQAMVKEILEGRGPIYFDMRHFDNEHYLRVRRIIPITMAALDDAGINPRKELVPCRPMVTWIGAAGCGGLKIDLHGETNVPGLLAAGIAAQFPGCAESLSGLKISVCSVFGYRAGERAARIAAEQMFAEIDGSQLDDIRKAIFAPAKRQTGIGPMEVYQRLAKKLVHPEFSIVKREETIREMLKEVARVEEEDLPRLCARDFHELIKTNEARNFVHMMAPAYVCALERKESRLTHYRCDFPYRDDVEWLKWVVVKKVDSGLGIRYEPLPLETSPVKPEKREKIPAPIQIS